MNRPLKTFLFLSFLCLASSLAFAESSMIQIVDMKTAQGIDEKYQAIDPSASFAAGTSKVFCWFKWKDAEVNSQVSTHWAYLTERTGILDYKITIPRREGAGGVAFSMPADKTLPPGEYEVRLETNDGKSLKSIKFKVLEK